MRPLFRLATDDSSPAGLFQWMGKGSLLIPVPLLFAFYLFTTNKNLFLRFAFAFFVINIIGFIIYYLHPAAPPWYVQQHGFQFIATGKSDAAGLLRTDAILGIPLFENI